MTNPLFLRPRVVRDVAHDETRSLVSSVPPLRCLFVCLTGRDVRLVEKAMTPPGLTPDAAAAAFVRLARDSSTLGVPLVLTSSRAAELAHTLTSAAAAWRCEGDDADASAGFDLAVAILAGVQ